MDSSLNMKAHVNNIIRSCYCQIRSLSKIRKYLTVESSKKLTHAFVTSRLDMLNSLLVNLPDTLIKKLQLIQNNAARLVTGQRRSCHVTPILMELHWLPVEYRIQYKMLLLVFKCLSGKAPSYLSSLLHHYTPSRSLRSSSQYLFQEVPARKKYGNRAFSLAGPKVWYSLPLEVRQSLTVEAFKGTLKTHLFKLGYNN